MASDVLDYLVERLLMSGIVGGRLLTAYDMSNQSICSTGGRGREQPCFTHAASCASKLSRILPCRHDQTMTVTSWHKHKHKHKEGDMGMRWWSYSKYCWLRAVVSGIFAASSEYWCGNLKCSVCRVVYVCHDSDRHRTGSWGTACTSSSSCVGESDSANSEPLTSCDMHDGVLVLDDLALMKYLDGHNGYP